MKIYALLIGINEYRNEADGIGRLSGCLNDMMNFQSYLMGKPFKVPEAQILTIFNEKATKAAIVAAFKAHFANATKDDVCIFYFSGHGVRQDANDGFKIGSINGALECLACHDTDFGGHNLLADKEQRWLIHQLYQNSGGCHILTLFDCCHSGDNTRAVGKNTNSDPKNVVLERTIKARGGLEFIMPKRDWADFIFAKTITEKMVNDVVSAGNALNTVLPQGRHVQLAACASNETAKESGGHGYFSKYLMELLETSNGKMTYFDLRSLVHRQLSNLPPERRQTPQFYAVESSLFQPFLGGAAQTSVEATVNFNGKADIPRWEMSMGSIYGIYKGATVFVTLPHKNNEVEAATVQEVFHDCSVLSFDIENVAAEQAKPDAEKRIRRTDNYKASTARFIQAPLKIACISPALRLKWANFCKKYPVTLENASLKVVSNAADADYVLNTEGSKIFIADPNYPARPMVKMLEDDGKTDAAFEGILKQLTAVSRWTFVKNQKNAPESDDLLKNLSITLTRAGKTIDLQASDAPTSFPVTKYQWVDEQRLNFDTTDMTIEITNNHPTDTLYIAGIWLSEAFGIECSILKGNSVATPLDKDESAYLYDETGVKTFNLGFGSHVFADKWDKIPNFIKIYVSTLPFDITQFGQMALTYPRQETMRSTDVDRAVGRLNITPKMPRWAVKTIALESDVSQLKR